MSERVKEELQKSLEFDFEIRSEHRLENPSKVEIKTYWRMKRSTTRINFEGNVIGYNVFMILEDGIRHLDDEQELKKQAEIAFQQKDMRESVAQDIVNRWNQIYKGDPKQAVSVLTLFHSLERIVFRKYVPRQENDFTERFIGEAIDNLVGALF